MWRLATYEIKHCFILDSGALSHTTIHSEDFTPTSSTIWKKKRQFLGKGLQRLLGGLLHTSTLLCMSHCYTFIMPYGHAATLNCHTVTLKFDTVTIYFTFTQSHFTLPEHCSTLFYSTGTGFTVTLCFNSIYQSLKLFCSSIQQILTTFRNTENWKLEVKLFWLFFIIYWCTVAWTFFYSRIWS